MAFMIIGESFFIFILRSFPVVGALLSNYDLWWYPEGTCFKPV